MKKFMIIICVLKFLILVVCCLLFYPVKYALKQENLENIETPYFLVQWTQVTGSSWVLVGDHNGYFGEPIYIVANGAMPFERRFNYAIATGHNTYICYGNYVGEREISDGGDKFSEYQFTGWDILYPVKRNGLIQFLPKSYLCKLDF